MKRRVQTILVFLLLGALINVAVAWGCAWIEPHNRDGQNLYGRGGNGYEEWWAGLHSRPGAMRVEVFRFNAGDPNVVWDGRATYEADFSTRVPRWSRAYEWRFQFDENGFAPGPKIEMEEARGWPMLSMRCTFDVSSFILKWSAESNPLPAGAVLTHTELITPPTTASDAPTVLRLAPGDCVRGGILIREGTPPMWWDSRMIPLQPIWPGFAINTVFYAAILWGLFATLFALRRRRRLKRGLCPACAYPIGASDVCTECGRAVKK